jgi:hypothetical protein
MRPPSTLQHEQSERRAIGGKQDFDGAWSGDLLHNPLKVSSTKALRLSSPQEFFHRHIEFDPHLSDIIHPSLIDSTIDADDVPDETYRYLTYLGSATNTGQESFLDDFDRETLLIPR